MSTASRRVEDGFERVKIAALPVLQAAIAATVAYQVSLHLLGHETPFFAAVAAWMCLGWSFDRNLRRVVEIAVGVTLGVGIADLVVRFLGQGWWQLIAIVVSSVLIARFVDSGALLATQAGAQAIVIFGIPTLTGGAYGRALDAALGGAIALCFAVLTPYFPERAARRSTAEISRALATTATQLANGLRLGDTALMDEALETGRSTDHLIANASGEVAAAHTQVRWSINRSKRTELAALQETDLMMDRAMRSLRVMARRVRFDITDEHSPDREKVANLLAEYAVICEQFAVITEQSGNYDDERVALEALGSQIRNISVTEEWATTAIALFRAVVVDTMLATGATFEQAKAVVGGREIMHQKAG